MKEIFILKESIGCITKASDLFGKIKKIKIDYEQENLLIFYLDAQNKVKKMEILFKGGVKSCISDFKTIFRNALKNCACSIIVAHNHPSGDLTPSEEDKTFYSAIKEAGDLLSIKVLDSVIFNKTSFYSMI